MAGSCVIGLQWGDEAKGKLVDLLTQHHDIVARFLGGANAGHTVVDGENVYKLHHIPSGILRSEVLNVITAGVVINPPILLGEMDGLTDRGVSIDNLRLSDRSHIIFPWHIAEDRAMNQGPPTEKTSAPHCVGSALATATRLAGRTQFAWEICFARALRTRSS